MAARDAGADVRVLVLHRPIPPLRTLREGPRAAAAAARELLRQPRRAELDGLQVEYVPFVSPPRPRTLRDLGRLRGAVDRHRAAPAAALVPVRPRPRPQRRARRRGRAAGADLRAARRLRPRRRRLPHRPGVGRRARAPCRAALSSARLVLANSAGIERMSRAMGAERTRVVHLGADVPNGHIVRGPGPDARDASATSSPASATPTSCARCGSCATGCRRCATSSSATARSARRSSASPAISG